jgi:DNA-binding GntR family transcriptional regulator
MDRRTRAPEYKRVADELRARIGPEFGVGDLLPSLPQIEEQYEVSRDVARRALMELRLAGLISTQHGVGSTVETLPRASQTSSPSEEEIMRRIGTMQAQIDDLADGLAEIRRERGLPPRRQEPPADRTSS